jgi:hypothetical protein
MPEGERSKCVGGEIQPLERGIDGFQCQMAGCASGWFGFAYQTK